MQGNCKKYCCSGHFRQDIYLSGEDPRFYKRGPTEINASGGSQPRKEEGASHHARRGKNAEAFLKQLHQSDKYSKAGSIKQVL